MRIAVDARSLGAVETGPGVYTRQLIERMSAAVPEWEFVLYWGRRQQGTPMPGGANVRARHLGLPGGRKLGNLIFEQVLLPAAVHLDRCDLLWSPTFVLPLRKHGPQVVTMHDVIPLLFLKGQSLARRMVYHRLLRLNAGQADCILTVSQSSARDIIERLDVPPWKVRAIWNGLEDGFSLPRPEEAGETALLLQRHEIEEPFALCTTGLLPRKNAHGVLEAFARAFRDDHSVNTLVLTGQLASGGNTEYVLGLRERARDLGIESRVRFPGFLPRGCLRLLYGRALFSVDASFYEGFGFPVIEAMACGSPVIASDCSSLPEVAGDAALLVNPASVEEMAKAMTLLAREEALRSKLRALGLARTASFSWDESARETLSVFRELLGERHTPVFSQEEKRAA